jgi:hypothetical protein
VAEALGGDLDALPAAYTKARLPDARAMQQLEFMSVLSLPGSKYGNPLSRAWARAVLLSATVLGLLGARIAAALGFGPKKAKAAASAPGARAASGRGTDAARSSPLFRAPWVRDMYNPAVNPRGIVRWMYVQTAALAALLAAALAALVWAGRAAASAYLGA